MLNKVWNWLNRRGAMMQKALDTEDIWLKFNITMIPLSSKLAKEELKRFTIFGWIVVEGAIIHTMT